MYSSEFYLWGYLIDNLCKKLIQEFDLRGAATKLQNMGGSPKFLPAGIQKRILLIFARVLSSLQAPAASRETAFILVNILLESKFHDLTFTIPDYWCEQFCNSIAVTLYWVLFISGAVLIFHETILTNLKIFNSLCLDNWQIESRKCVKLWTRFAEPNLIISGTILDLRIFI